MAKKALLAGMVLLFGMIITVNLEAQTDNRLNGSWVVFIEGAESKYIFRDGNFDIVLEDIIISKGTYTTNGNNITIRITHVHGEIFGGMFEYELYSIDELKESPMGPFISLLLPDEILITTMNYSISGNTLAMTTRSGETTIYTRE